MQLLLFNTCFSYVYFVIFKFWSHVKSVISKIEQDWRREKDTDEYTIIKRNSKLTNYLAGIVLVSYNSMILFHLLIAINSCFSGNIEDKKFTLREFLPFEARNSPVFELTCIAQFMLLLFTLNNHVVIECLLLTAVMDIFFIFNCNCLWTHKWKM